MPVDIVFETHSTTLDNEAGIATGWLPGRLSASGRAAAGELGDRYNADPPDLVITSDLARAVETARLAFGSSAMQVLKDVRLRECNYGSWNGVARSTVFGAALAHVDAPYPNGESWRQAVERVGEFVHEMASRWSGTRALIIGHSATRFGLEVELNGASLTKLLSADATWQPGWRYRIE